YGGSKMSVLIKQIHSRFGTIPMLLVAALIISASVAVIASQDKSKSLSGNWALTISLEGGGNDQTPVALSFVDAGGKLSGKVSVTDVVNTSTGPQRSATATDMLMTDLKFNGKDLSFKVINGEDSFTGELAKINDDLFTGVWESPIGERWKGSKVKFSGTLKMARTK
ncbi:MAG: hypothetical protein AAB401_24870, partial [Acidobacteriota bacterium]